MLAALTLFGLRDIWLMNSLKILLAVLMNAAAVVTFIIAGLVHWQWTIVVAVGAIAEGTPGCTRRGGCPRNWSKTSSSRWAFRSPSISS
jgi:hypothetical protein